MRVSPGKILCVLALLGLVILETPVRHFFFALTGRFQDAYVTYRLVSERDALLAANQRLSEEVQTLKSEALAGEFETKVLTQLEELQGIVEGATELDLERGPAPATARKGVKGRDALVAILENPALNKKQGSSGKKSEGNAQRTRGVNKENIAFTPGLLTLRPGLFTPTDPNAEWSGKRKRIVKRADRLAQALRVLPIGYPAEGEMTSGFGYRVSPFSSGRHMHEGLDISLSKGGDVLATGSGEVINVEHDGAYGWVVDIEHAPGLTTRYAHLSKTLVKVGKRVERGDRIALSGNSGRSTGPHLHYEVRVNGKPRDPKAYVLLPQKLAAAF
jgi:murein DD-endopeptidase MepM/ murein hydrolase activator NlpD